MIFAADIFKQKSDKISHGLFLYFGDVPSLDISDYSAGRTVHLKCAAAAAAAVFS